MLRAQDASGKWSMMQHLLFFNMINTAGVIPDYDAPGEDIVAIEYFIDNDPGEGMATAFAITPGQDVIHTDMIDVFALTPGMHKLHVRAQDASGKWSMMQHLLFFNRIDMTNTIDAHKSPGAPIVYAEYFFDTDPGRGNGLQFDFTPGQDVIFMDGACVSGLTPGDHLMHVRVQDGDSLWSLFQVDTITIDSGCNVYLCETQAYCNDNGTPLDYSDDTYDLGLIVSSTDGSTAFNISGDITGSGSYSCTTPAVFDNGGSGFSYSGSPLSIIITDADSSGCTFDTIIPVPVPDAIACHDVTVSLDAMGNGSVAVSDIVASATCGADTVTLDQYDFSCADVGIASVQATLTDHQGNMTSCMSQVTVETQTMLTIPDDPILNGTYIASDRIISTGVVPAAGVVTFQAGNMIELNPGFTHSTGSNV